MAAAQYKSILKAVADNRPPEMIPEFKSFLSPEEDELGSSVTQTCLPGWFGRLGKKRTN